MEGDKRRLSNSISSVAGKTENGSSLFQQGNRQDPYVIRAAEKAKNKLRDRILGLSGGRLT